MKTLIKNLVEAFGPSGFEDAVRELIRAEIEPFVNNITVDAMGNLIAHRKGNGAGVKVMIAAHMDEIGFMASHITKEGFVRFATIGGVSNVPLAGTRVKFADGTIGIAYTERPPDTNRLHPVAKYYVDVGATSQEDCPVNVGDAGIFWQPFVERGDHLTAKSMDDRIGCAILIAVIQQLESSDHDLYFVFTTQEEVGVRGATTAANSIDPDVGIAVDVTACGDTPNGWNIDVKLGQGPAVKIKDAGMIAHQGLVRLLCARAESAEIPYQREVLLRGSSDARAIQMAGAGVAAGTISIPCRYIHSTSETVSLSDVENTVKLLTTVLTNPLDLS